MRSVKKSLLITIITILLSFGLMIGSTFAWFTDSVSSDNNIIQTGNIDIDVQYTLDGESWGDLDGAKDLFQKGLWEPGHTEVIALKITNQGKLALKYSACMNIIKEVAGKNNNGDAIVLSDLLTVSTITQNVDVTGDNAVKLAFTAESPDGLTYSTPVSFKFGDILQDDTVLLPGDAQYVIVKVDMPQTIGNEANHDGVNVPYIEFGVNVLATQTPYEGDSFDDSYDKDASLDNDLTFDDLENSNYLARESKTLDQGADSIDFTLIADDGAVIAKVNVPASAIKDTTKPVTVSFDNIESAFATVENISSFAYDISVSNLKDDLSGDQLVTVVVTAPTALAAMQAYHNGDLMTNAVYDEVAGTITFKTASFSPYDFTANVTPVNNLAELRTVLNTNNANAKLMADITVDLTKDTGAARDINHAYVGTKSTYYNGVLIQGKNVGLDLNGHNITVLCGDKYNSNSDVGALFFIGNEGSLNITNTGAVNTGYIKMASSIYAVWAPFDDPSYVDIYGGSFIADSYAGDIIGTPYDENGNIDMANGTMKNENSNRALIYAGFGGNINVYGGYFLYNNTPNDTKDRNNGAFNAKDFYEGDTPLLTIHDGVMLINKEYRQNPANTSQPHGSYDNYSVKLEKDCAILEISSTPVTIAGKQYPTWYKVVMGIKSIYASLNKGIYNIDHQFTAEDFSVYAISNNGNSGKISNFTFTETSSTVDTKTFTITYTDDMGESLTSTCVAKVMNLKLLDDTVGSRLKQPISVVTGGNGSYNKPYTYAEAPFLGTGNFSVSGWAWLINGAYTYDYFANNNLEYTAPNGEVVSNFNNKLVFTGTGNNRTGKYADGFYGLTIDNAKQYTTLGINCVVGCLEDAPQLKGFGVYVDDDLSTLKWNAPAAVYTEGGMFSHYGWNNGHSVLEMDCGTFEPGKSYTVHWVLVFEDGLTSLCDWTVNMAPASSSDKVFIDTSKPNANVIIMAGQSNMFGPAPLTQDIINKYASVDYSNVYIKYANINFDVAPDGSIPGTLSTVFSNTDFQKYQVGIGAQGNTYFGPELALAHHLATNSAFNSQQWFIVKYAPAGTALGSQWTSNCVIDGKTTTLTNDMLNYVQTAIDSLSNDYDVHVRSFMWMQGESDAASQASATNYGSLEKTLVNRVRETFAGYATRATNALSVVGSGISFINAGIADNDTGKNSAQGGPNDWIYAADVNACKVDNAQYWCSLAAMGYPNYMPTKGPLAGIQFQVNAPSQPNPTGGNIVNSIFIDTHKFLSKAAAHNLDPSNPLYEDYGNVGDNTDWAHYSANSMEQLGQLFGSCVQYLIQQNG